MRRIAQLIEPVADEAYERVVTCFVRVGLSSLGEGATFTWRNPRTLSQLPCQLIDEDLARRIFDDAFADKQQRIASFEFVKQRFRKGYHPFSLLRCTTV